MNCKIIHFYPHLMNLYGSYANLTVLRRYLELLGHSVDVVTVAPGENAQLSDADFIFMGAGTERSQKAALQDFRRFEGDIRTIFSYFKVPFPTWPGRSRLVPPSTHTTFNSEGP